MNWEALQTKKFIAEIAAVMAENKESLIALDGKVGDGDLGLTMSDGFQAASQAIQDMDQQDVGKLLYFAGKAMAAKVPSTMGTLMANGMITAGKQMKGNAFLDGEGVCNMMAAWQEGVEKMGKAKEGDKTFLDGFAPGVRALKENSHKTFKVMAQEGAKAAEKGAQNTVGMLAVHGRAAIRGEDSRKLLDPGAVVAGLIMKALAQSL